jgi:hypothetical protein
MPRPCCWPSASWIVTTRIRGWFEVWPPQVARPPQFHRIGQNAALPTVARDSEQAHMPSSGVCGLAAIPLPTLGVSSLDLGRSTFERPLSLCRRGRVIPLFLRAAARLAPCPAMRECDFCDARKPTCKLCAAHLNLSMRGGDFGRCSAALLGRFLPRLGPFGLPSGPFYLGLPHFRDVTFSRGQGLLASNVVLRCNIFTKVKLTACWLFRRGSPLE